MYQNDDWLNKACSIKQAEDWPKFISHSQAWAESVPDDFRALHALGIAYDKTGDFEQAVLAYNKCIKINPNNSDVWYNLGLVYG